MSNEADVMIQIINAIDYGREIEREMKESRAKYFLVFVLGGFFGILLNSLILVVLS